MASRIGKQRKQKKYSEGGVVFTPAFTQRIDQSAAAASDGDCEAHDAEFAGALGAFWTTTRSFTTLGSAEAELDGVRGLVESLAALARACDAPGGIDVGDDATEAARFDDDDDVPPAPARGARELAFVAAARAFFGLMFLPNSRQLHRALITSRKKLGSGRGAQLAELALLQETSTAIDAATEADDPQSIAASMRPATALASVNMVQPQSGTERRVLRGVAVRAAALIARGVDCMIDESLSGRRVPPSEMEVAQDAVSVAYSLVQRHLASFGNLNVPGSNPPGGEQGPNAIAEVCLALARTLSTEALSREAAVSAGVTFSALGGVAASPAQHACAIADAFFGKHEGGTGDDSSSWRVANGLDSPPIDSVCLGAGSGTEKIKTFASLAREFTAFGELAAVRGALTALNPIALACPLVRPAGSGTKSNWCLLLDGALPRICGWMENPRDQHFKFHASAALKSALARAKTCADEFDDFAIPEPLIDRILTVLWANWEDPLTQTVKEIQGAFGHLLELNGKSPTFLARVASQLIERGAHSKGRYVPLAALVPKMGARKLLELRPNLLEESLDAMRDDSVCCAAGTLIKELSAALLCEMESEERESANLGIKPGTPSQTPSERWVIGNGKGKKGDTDKGRGRGRDEVCIREGGGVALNKWREWWIPVTLSALLRPGRERAGCAQYALPHLMRQDAASIVFLLEGLKKEVDEEADEADEGQTKEADKSQTTKEAAGDPTAMDPMATFKIPGVKDDEDDDGSDTGDGSDDSGDGSDDERRSAALVALLKRARAASLLDADTGVAFVCESVSIASGIQMPPGQTKYPVDERMLAAATVCRDRGTCKEALELLCLDGKRFSLPGLLELRLLRRALPCAMRGESAAFRNALGTMIRGLLGRIKVGQGRVAVNLRAKGKGSKLPGGFACESDFESSVIAAELAGEFVEWLIDLSLASTYPGAPYERKYMALDMLNAVAETWGVGTLDDEKAPDAAPESSEDLRRAIKLETSPYTRCLGADVTTSLLGALVDSWDRLRVSAFTLLSRHPAPLQGVTTVDEFGARARWALGLLRSPRVRESDAAALLMRLLLRKYAVDLGWDVTLSPRPQASVRECEKRTKGETAARLLGTMCDLIEVECVKAECDLLAACRQSLAHGALLATRYILAEIDFNAGCKEGRAGQTELKATLARLLELLSRVTRVALASIASPDGALLGTSAGELAPDRLGGGSGQGAAAAAAAAAAVGATASPSTFDDDDEDVQTVTNLAPDAQTITTACWLTMKEVSLLIGELSRAVPGDDETLLEPASLKACGEHLLHVLLSMKHNGAIEKTRVGLVCLGERLLQSSNPALSSLPATWLESLFKKLTSPEQGIKDLIRRSAGLPFGFTAVFLAEPAGVPRKLLHGAMARLLDIAADDGEHVRAGGVAEGTSEGVHVPQVHAFNALRQAFSVTEIATETTAFVSRGVEVCVRGFKSPHWEVRNGATLAYASLVTKICGYGNTHAPAAGGASRRMVTGLEFFKRYPSLHPFLLAELTDAADALERPGSPVHPSLWPILAMLSRLRPSKPMDASTSDDTSARTKSEDPLSPAAFVPVVRRCARGRPAAIRAVAARALAPLIDPSDVASAVRVTLRNVRESIAFNRQDKGVDGGTLGGKVPSVGHNTAHGIMLCVKGLFAPEGPATALLRSGQCDEVVNALASAAAGLENCAYLATESPVASTAAEWLGCCEHVFELAEETLGVVDARDFLEELRTLAWKATELAEGDERFGAFVAEKSKRSKKSSEVEERSEDLARTSVAPHDVLWAKTAARLRTKLALTGGVGALRTDNYISVGLLTMTLISETLSRNVRYEARGSSMKALRDAGVESVGAQLDVNMLRTHVANVVLPHESRHSCKRRALQLLGDWTEFSSAGENSGGAMDREHASEEDDAEWSIVERLASSDPNERVRCAAVACLGKLAASRVALWERRGTKQGTKNDNAASLVALIEAGCSPERPEDVRRAAAEALKSSTLLSALPQSPGGQRRTKDEDEGTIIYHDDPRDGPILGAPILSAWRSALELLEDEDEDVRSVASDAVTAVRGLNIPRDVSTETCLRRAFKALAKRLARWPPYERWLLTSCAGRRVSKLELIHSIDDMCTVRRLFDREADNHHAEPLLLAQLAASAIARTDAIRVDVCSEELEVAIDAIESITDALVSSVETAPDETAGTHGGSNAWEGGATNHEVAFAPVCRACLCVWALATALTASGVRESQRSMNPERVRLIDEKMARCALAPMAGAMWASARVALIGRKDWRTGEAEGVEGGAYANVDPCFLLE